jgi:DNA modification methylase
MATALLGDCLKVMATLPDKSVDCFICDLPYGQLAKPERKTPLINFETGTILTGRAYSQKGGCPWDNPIDLTEFWKQVKRLAKDDHTPVLMFCNTRFGIELINSNPKWFRYDLVWNKGAGVSFLLANKQPMKSHEMIYVFSKAGAYYNRIDEEVEGKGGWFLDRDKEKNVIASQYNTKRFSGDGIQGRPDGKRCALSVINNNKELEHNEHPTKKPLGVLRWLLKRYVPKNGTVLDPTAGTFNSGVVATELGYKYIGIEMDNNFFWKGAKKLMKASRSELQTSNIPPH